LLVDNGIDPRATNRKGWTVLHALCCRPNQRGFVPDMLDVGVDLHAKANDGSNALPALVSNHYEHPQLLSHHSSACFEFIDVNVINFI